MCGVIKIYASPFILLFVTFVEKLKSFGNVFLCSIIGIFLRIYHAFAPKEIFLQINRQFFVGEECAPMKLSNRTNMARYSNKKNCFWRFKSFHIYFWIKIVRSFCCFPSFQHVTKQLGSDFHKTQTHSELCSDMQCNFTD